MPRDMPEADAFDLTLALGCFWETVEVTPSVSLRGAAGSETSPIWLVGAEGQAFAHELGGDLRSVVPTGEGALLSSAWHDGVGSLWATELPGAMWRLEDGDWERFDSGVDEALLAVDGTAPDAAWAVGLRGRMARWDGEDWSAEPSMVPHDLEAVSASAPDDVWAVGSGDEGGVVLHFDGSGWTARDFDARLHDVHAEAPDDVWAVGEGVFHWDGRSWTEEPVDGSGEWIGVLVTGSRVWIAGAADRVLVRKSDGSWLVALEDAGFLWDLWMQPLTGDIWIPSEGRAHHCVRFVL